MTELDPARNENFRFLVDATPDLILALDEEGTIRYAGPEASEVLVDSREALVGRLLFDLIHPDDRGTLPQDALGLATIKANGTTHWEVRLQPAEDATPESELDRESARWINLAGRDRREDGLGIVVFVRDVTEKRRAANEAWLIRRAVDAANNLVVIADARAEDRPLVFANSHFLEVTGYEREEVIGQNCRFLQIRPDGTRDGDQEGRWVLRDAVEEGDRASTLIRNYRKDGSLFWNELYLSPLRNPDGTITHFVGVQNDVTAREEARRSLEDRERLLRSFYDSAPVMMGVAELVERDGREQVCYRYVNRASTHIFEQDPETVTDKTAAELGFPPDEAQVWADHYRESHEAGEPVRFETSFPWESDTEGEGVRTLDVVVTYLEQGDEGPRFSFIADDVTERRRVERARRLLEAAVESTAEPLLITGPELDEPGPEILYANPAFFRMTGYEPDELIGRSPRVLQGPRTDRSLLNRLRRQLKDERPFRGETINYRKDGSEYVVEWEIAPIYDDEGELTHWVATQRDVTDRRLLEHQVLDAASRTQERIGQDLHDSLGQLLTGTSFLAESLRNRLTTEDAVAERVAEDAQRIAELLQEGVGQARALARNLHPVDMEAGGFATALQRLADSVHGVYDIECSFDAEVPLSAVPTPRGVDLYRIAQEAVTNAIRHGRPSTIAIRMTRLETITTEVVGTEALSDYVLLIEDDGLGISDEELEHARGMGMHTMRYRARRLGGELRVQRRPSGGTAVICRFDPAAEPTEID